MCILQRVSYSVQYAVCIVQCSVRNVYRTVCSLQCVSYSVECDIRVTSDCGLVWVFGCDKGR